MNNLGDERSEKSVHSQNLHRIVMAYFKVKITSSVQK